MRSGAPSGTGLDARAVGAFVDAWEAADGLEAHGLAVVHRGVRVACATWAPYRADEPRLVYSVSKTVTACALGLAVRDGLVGLDDRVVDVLPHLVGPRTPPAWSAVTVRHCAAMATGHAEDPVAAAWAADPDPVRGFLTLAPTLPPGSRFVYDQPATQVLAAVVEHVTGEGLLDLVRRRLLRPLGAGDGAWAVDPTGRGLGFSGYRCTVDDLARLGLLLLRDGRWGGDRLLPDGWVQEVSRVHATTAEHEQGPDWRLGYGLQVWRSRHGWRADGAYGQFVLVVPEADLVVALTGQTEDTQQLLDLVWQHLVPAAVAAPGAAGRSPGDAARHGGARDDAARQDAELLDRLSAVRLPDGAARGAAPDRVLPVDGLDAEVRGTALVGRLRLRLRPGDAGSVALTLDDGVDELAVEVDGAWSRHPAGTTTVAATLTAAADGHVGVELRPTHLPHALTVDVAHGSGSPAADLRWTTEPLSPSPLTLGAVLRP